MKLKSNTLRYRYFYKSNNTVRYCLQACILFTFVRINIIYIYCKSTFIIKCVKIDQTSQFKF